MPAWLPPSEAGVSGEGRGAAAASARRRTVLAPSQQVLNKEPPYSEGQCSRLFYSIGPSLRAGSPAEL